MPRAGRDFRLDDFRGGLNVRDSPRELGANEASYVENYQPDGQGLRVRPGDTPLSFSTLAAGTPDGLLGIGTALFVWVRNGLTPSLYRVDLPAGTFSNLGSMGGSPGGASTSGVRAPASGGQGPYYFTSMAQMLQSDGVAGPALWTAATGTLPLSQLIASAGNRVWVANVVSGLAVSDPSSAVAWCDLGDPRAWPAANVTMFGPGDGEMIVGIYRLGDGLVVMKNSRSWFIYDLDTSANREIGLGSGGVGLRSACETPMGLMFISAARGLVVTDGGGVKVVSDAILPIIKYLRSNGMILTARLVYSNDSVILQAANHLYEYRFEEKSWWHHTLANGFSIATLNGGADLYALEGQLSAWRSTKLFTGATIFNGAGGSLSPMWLSGMLDFGNRSRKRITSLTVEGSAEWDDNVSRAGNAVLWEDVDDTVVAQQGPVNAGVGTFVSAGTGQLPLRLPAGRPLIRAAIDLSGHAAVSSVTALATVRGRR